jgi:hypothetical protein
MSCVEAEGFDWCGEVFWHASQVLTMSSTSLMCDGQWNPYLMAFAGNALGPI